jgi:ABC-type sulfate/molybdate transport systems ATPase subunit
MALEVKISKKLAEFTLEAAFTADAAPLSILGASGAGKTMLLRCIAGLATPDSGRVAFDDEVFFDSERRVNVPARQRRLGFVFQHYALFPHKTAEENVRFGLTGAREEEKRGRVAELLARAHATGLGQRYPRELSGGEQQRVALARALAIEPRALLLDEPLSALDTHLRSQVEALLQETIAEGRRPTLLVTHNMEEAYRLGERLLVLSRGRVVATGPKKEIFQHPPTREVALLTGCKNFSRARLISTGEVEALDWGCRLRVAQQFERAPAFVGIRAHHIDFAESSGGAIEASPAVENTLPCRLVRASETPFRMTLYLRLDAAPADAGEFQLQAEVFKEKWERIRERPQPWHVRLAADSLFVTPE